MKPYSKAIAAFLSSLLSALAVAAPDGLTKNEFVAALLTALATTATVYFAPKNAD